MAITDNQADATINIADGAITYTFTFDQVVDGFTVADIDVANGTKGAFTPSAVVGEVGKVFTLVVTPTANAEGEVTVNVVAGNATDANGNQNTVAIQSTQVFDTKAPNAGILSFNQGATVAQNGIATNNGTFTLSIGGQEAGAGVQFERSADAGVTWTNVNADQTGLAGSYRFRAQVTDPAGNVSTTGLLVVIVGTTAPASDLKAIDQLLGASVFDATALTKITGSAIDIVDVLNSAGITKAGNVALEVTAGTATLAQVNTMDAATSGVLTATVTEQNLAALATLADSANNALTITVVDTTQAAETLNTLNGKTTLQVDATAATTLTGTAADLKTALNHVGLKFAGNVAVTVAAGVVPAVDLSSIDAKTTGVVNAVAVPELTGTAAEVRAVADASPAAIQLAAAFTATINDAITIAQLAAIDAKTTGVINHPSFADTAANLAAQAEAGGFLTTGNKPVSISDDHTLAQLRAINNATTGAITLSNRGIALSGSAAAVSEALAGFIDYEGSVSLIDNHSLAQLKAINAATSGTITLGNKNITLTGSAADVAAALAGITDYTGAVVLNDAHDMAQLKAINAATTGAITLANAGVALEGSAADLSAALAGITTYTGIITVTGSSSLAQLAAIDAATSGSLNYTTIIDSAANLAANTDGYLAGNKNVTFTNNHTLAQLKAINESTTGTITLASKAIPLTGTAADLSAALAGFTDYTGTVEVTGTASVAQLTVIDAATTPAFTYPSVTDTAANLAAVGAAGFIVGKPVTITGDHTLAQLKAINDGTTGAITLANAAIALNGPAADLVAALAGITTYTGAITVADSPSIAQLAAIDAATSGAITYNSVTDTPANLAANQGNYVTGNKPAFLTGDHSAVQLKAINLATSGAINLANAALPLEGPAADLVAALAGFTNYAGAITVTDSPSIAQLAAIDLATQDAVAINYGSVTDTAANLLQAGAAVRLIGKNVTVTGSPTIVELTAIAGLTAGMLTYTSITDTAVNLIANAGGYVKDNKPVTVLGTATIAQLLAIDGMNAGAVTSVIRDTATNILAAADLHDGAAQDNNAVRIGELGLLFQADKIQVTDWNNAHDLRLLDKIADPESARIPATDPAQYNDWKNLITKNDFNIELLVSVDTALTAADAALLQPVDKILLQATGTDLTIDASAFAPTDQVLTFGDLVAIEAGDGAANTTVTIADVAGDGSTIDLKQITSVKGLTAFAVQGDTGANVIQLSSALTTSGTTTVDLGNDDVRDSLIFNVAAADFQAAANTALGNTTVANFDTTVVTNSLKDQFSVFYDGASGIGNRLTTSSVGGVQNLSVNNALVEIDSALNVGVGDDPVDIVTEVKTAIASAIGSLAVGLTRVTTVGYLYDEVADASSAVVMAANLVGAVPTADLGAADAFSVVSVARLLNVAENAISHTTNVTGTKPAGLS